MADNLLTFVASICRGESVTRSAVGRMTIVSPDAPGTTRPVISRPSVVRIVFEVYCDEIMCDGWTIDSTSSLRVKRLDTLVKSGPVASPCPSKRWHLAH